MLVIHPGNVKYSTYKLEISQVNTHMTNILLFQERKKRVEKKHLLQPQTVLLRWKESSQGVFHSSGNQLQSSVQALHLECPTLLRITYEKNSFYKITVNARSLQFDFCHL